MPKTTEIKTRLSLEGEQQFKRAMDDAASAMRVLNAEQKLAAAEFRASGDAETYASERARILAEKIEQQKRVVESAQKALNEMKTRGVDPNSRAYRTMETRVINAQTSLTNMQAELQETTNDLSTSGEAAETYNEQLSSIGQGITLQGAIDAIGRVTDAIKNVAVTAAHVMQQTWDIMNGAGDWADELLTNAQIFEIDPETLQRWDYAARFIDTSVDTIAGARQRLVRNMASSSEETALAFNALHVATETANGEYRDSYSVMWDVVDALGAVENAATRDNLAQTLLGRSYTDLLPLINAGREAFEEYAAAAPIVSDESVAKLGAMDDAFEDLNATVEATKYETLAALAPTFTEIAKAMSGTVAAFKEFVQTEEGQAALQRVGDAVSAIFDSLKPGEGGFTAVVDAAAEAITALGGGLEWISNHSDGVVTAVEAIALAFGALKVSEGVLTFMQLANGAKLMFGGRAAALAKGAAASAPAAAASGGGLWAGLGKAGTALMSGIAGAGKALAATAAPWLGPPAVGLALGGVAGAVLDYSYTEDKYGKANEALKEQDALVLQTSRDMTELAAIFEDLGKYYSDYSVDTLPYAAQVVRDNEELLKQYLDMEALLDGYELPEEISGVDWLETAEAVGRIYAAIGEQLESEKSEINLTTESLISDYLGLGNALGEQIQTMSDAVAGEKPELAETAEDLAQTVPDTVGDVMSARVMADLGSTAGRSVADGILSSLSSVRAAANVVAATAVSAMSGAFSALSALPSYGGSTYAGGVYGNTGSINATIVMDKTAVGRMVAPAVDGIMGAMLYGR